jgi:histone acetyltransferase (RNA polymerase elongator complex component)
MVKHYTIPIFIPELACPHQCIFCDQRKISGQNQIPTINDVRKKIETYLITIPRVSSRVEIGFFGGSFTGLPIDIQKKYLEVAKAFVEDGRVKGIRLSTRPDYISMEVLELLKKNKVVSIELGAQSMDAGVLAKSGRGHRVEDTEKASKLIIDYGFELVLQMMIGLPGDSLEKAKYTAKRIVDLGAKATRIYPTLVVEGTQLEQMYRRGTYQPLEINTAIEWVKALVLFFETNQVNIIKMGLHPSEELSFSHSLVAGPYHPSFRELVMTKIWKETFEDAFNNKKGNSLLVYVPPAQLNFAIGYKSENLQCLKSRFRQVKIKSDSKLINRNFYVDYY